MLYQIKNYINFIEEGLKRDLDSPLKSISAQLVLGCEPFVRKIRSMLKTGDKTGESHDVESNDTIRKLISHPIENIFEVVCRVYDVDKETNPIRIKIKNNLGENSIFLSFDNSIFSVTFMT